MEIKQKTYLEVTKDEKTVQLVVDATLPLGLIFDALMELKGFVVEKMTKAHEEEEVESQRMMGSPEEVKTEETTEIEA
jgi:hypothetical protein